MSKERLRLESIKSTIKLIKDYVDADTHHFETLALATELILNHGDWLIKQAERVGILQEQLDAKIMFVNKGDEEQRYIEQERMIELEEQNKRYREALEKISAPIYKVTYADMVAVKRIARQALEGEE